MPGGQISVREPPARVTELSLAAASSKIKINKDECLRRVFRLGYVCGRIKKRSKRDRKPSSPSGCCALSLLCWQKEDNQNRISELLWIKAYAVCLFDVGVLFLACACRRKVYNSLLFLHSKDEILWEFGTVSNAGMISTGGIQSFLLAFESQSREHSQSKYPPPKSSVRGLLSLHSLREAWMTPPGTRPERS